MLRDIDHILKKLSFFRINYKEKEDEYKMKNIISMDELQGEYDILYRSKPQEDGIYEPGVGKATIKSGELIGIDALGVIWTGHLKIIEGNKIEYKATLDPSSTKPNVGLTNELGERTRDKQYYEGQS